MKLRRAQSASGGYDNAAMWRDNRADRTHRGVVLISGFQGQATHLYTRPDPDTLHDQLDLVLPTLKRGYPTAQCDSGAEWGAAAGVARFLNIITYGRAYLFADEPVHVYAQSHGGLQALKTLMAYGASQIRSMVIAITPVDLLALHAENRGGFTAASIETAYGGPPSAADSPAENTVEIAATGVPIMQIYGGADPYVTEAESVAFGEAVGADLVAMGDDVGHQLFFDRGLLPAFFDAHDD